MNKISCEMTDSVFETLPSGMILFTVEGDILRLNCKAAEILGLSPDARPRSLKWDLPDYLAPLAAVLSEKGENVERGELSLSLPVREALSTLGFSRKWIDGDAGPPIGVFTFSDITQVLRDRLSLDKVKEELSQSRKLAAIGTMIAGVAHEMNNPLTGISMSASLLRMNLERLVNTPSIRSQPELLRHLEEALREVRKIAGAGEKAGALVSDLLSYAKPDRLFLQPHPLREVVRDIVGALKSHPQFSRFTIRIEGDTPHNVLCDRVKLEQVFYNLLKNACEATDGQGTAVLFFSEWWEEERHFVTAHVRDNGPGIDKTIINHIFDPFFTTKGHSGVGLGLSLSYRTVEQHGGKLSVESIKSQGTEFRVVLPVYLAEDTE